MVQIGYATQLAFILLIVGIYLLARPYNIARWHANDDAAQQRMHKREQGHRKKADRTPYQKKNGDVEPTPFAVKAFRTLGAALAIAGLVIGIWSLKGLF